MNDGMYDANGGAYPGPGAGPGGGRPDETMQLRPVGGPDETMRLGRVGGEPEPSGGFPGGPPGAQPPPFPGRPSPEASPPAARPGGRRFLARVLPTTLALLLVAGGAGYAAFTANGADHTAATAYWGKGAKEKPDPAGNVSEGRHDTELTKLLLPVSDDWRPGPDIGEYGNDAELSGKQAEAALKDGAVGLSGKDRRDYEKRIEKLGAQGVGLRSYTHFTDAVVAEVRITRYKDKSAIRNAYENSTEFLKALGLRKGPKIEGFSHSTCLLWPKGEESEEDDVDGMYCTAYQDDLLITGDFYGSRPFGKSDATALFKKQLEHLSSPGDYI